MLRRNQVHIIRHKVLVEGRSIRSVAPARSIMLALLSSTKANTRRATLFTEAPGKGDSRKVAGLRPCRDSRKLYICASADDP